MDLFYYCDKIQVLLRELNRLTNKTFLIQEIILNEANANPKLVNNMLVLLYKRYIYCTRCYEKSISVDAFHQFVKSYKLIKREIALSKKKLELHRLKWQSVNLKFGLENS